MINFRYHVISIVAVFLALGLGIVMGSTVIDRAIVDGLRNRIANAENNSIERKTENDRLRSSVKKQDEQDTALAGHTVRGYLTGQTVFVVTIGDIPEATRVETQELLSVSGARLGSVIDINEDFLKSDKTKIVKDLIALENVKTLVGNEKDKDSQVATVLTQLLNVRAGEAAQVTLPSVQVADIFETYKSFSEQEQAQSFDPVQPVSFILLVNRTDLDNERVASFVSRFHSTLPVSIGFVGNETDTPDRSDAIELLGATLAAFSVVDNAEAPSGRAALLIAHAENITGTHVIYGVSDKAKSPAPALSSP